MEKHCPEYQPFVVLRGYSFGSLHWLRFSSFIVRNQNGDRVGDLPKIPEWIRGGFIPGHGVKASPWCTPCSPKLWALGELCGGGFPPCQSWKLVGPRGRPRQNECLSFGDGGETDALSIETRVKWRQS